MSLPTKTYSAMSLEQARNVPWPLPPYQGRKMGLLVDNKQIALTDLSRVVETAYKESIRDAAATLMLHLIEKATLEPSLGHLNVVTSGRSYSVRRQFALTLLQGVIMGFALAIGVIMFISSILNRSNVSVENVLKRGLNPILLAVTVIALLILAVGAYMVAMFVLDKALSHLDKKIADYRKGEEGEERTVLLISRVLDGRWHLFRNINLPGRGGDLDAVLVGPTGVWLLEIKSFSRAFRNKGATWEYQAGNQWRTARKSPSEQANGNAIRLGNFLKADGVKQWVNAAVVWANPEAPVNVENPMVAVWTMDQLPTALAGLGAGKPMPEPQRQKIIDKLTRLCEAEIEKRKQTTA